jgi:hypothetical protein
MEALGRLCVSPLEESSRSDEKYYSPRNSAGSAS